MLNVVLIVAGILLNVIYMWCIYIIQKDNHKLTWKNYARYSCGACVGLVLSMLADPISFASVIVFTLMGATVSEALVTFFLVIKMVYTSLSFTRVVLSSSILLPPPTQSYPPCLST